LTLEFDKTRCFETDRDISIHLENMTPKSLQRSETVLGAVPFGATFVAQPVPGRRDGFPTLPKCIPPIIAEGITHDTKHFHNCENELEKSILFQAWSRGMREALRLKECSRCSLYPKHAFAFFWYNHLLQEPQATSSTLAYVTPRRISGAGATSSTLTTFGAPHELG
jgi:hypothetical protein